MKKTLRILPLFNAAIAQTGKLNLTKEDSTFAKTNHALKKRRKATMSKTMESNANVQVISVSNTSALMGKLLSYTMITLGTKASTRMG